MLNFAGRNLKVFFRQKSAVFFSLMGVFIIIGLYLLFLGDVWVEALADIPSARNLMDGWIMAGVVSITPITTAMGAFGIMVEDRAQKNSMDFYAAPVKRSTLVGGYVLSAYVIGYLLSVFALILGEIYITVGGGALLSPAALLQVLGILALSDLASSALVFFVVSFFTSSSAFATASSVIGTLIGFITGIFLPIGNLPGAVQWVVRLFPISHGSVLLRQVMMADSLATSFAGAPEGYLAGFSEMMGVTFSYGGHIAQPWVHLLVLAATAAVFFALALLVVSRKRK